MYTSAKEYLFQDEGKDGEFITVDQEHFDKDEIKIEIFKNEVEKNWGQQESQLRSAIYVSFVDEMDTNLLRKKVKKERRRSTFMKSRTSMQKQSKHSINSNSDREELSGKANDAQL
jgi:hypothetical protein